MSTMQIAVFPLDTERTLGIGDFMMSFMLLSMERNVKCKLTSTGAIIKADKEILLDILEELDSASFRKVAKKVAITINFDEGRTKTQKQIGLSEGESIEESSLERLLQAESNQNTLYDLVERRLATYIREEEEVLT